MLFNFKKKHHNKIHFGRKHNLKCGYLIKIEIGYQNLHKMKKSNEYRF